MAATRRSRTSDLFLMQAVEKPNFFPKTAAFESKPAAPAAPAAAAKAGGEGDGGKEKKAPPVVTVVTSGGLAPRGVFLLHGVIGCPQRTSRGWPPSSCRYEQTAAAAAAATDLCTGSRSCSCCPRGTPPPPQKLKLQFAIFSYLRFSGSSRRGQRAQSTGATGQGCNCRCVGAGDVWRVACGVWRVTCDVWRVTCDVASLHSRRAVFCVIVACA